MDYVWMKLGTGDIRWMSEGCWERAVSEKKTRIVGHLQDDIETYCNRTTIALLGAYEGDPGRTSFPRQTI